MVQRVSVQEVTEFRMAVAGVEVDWVRVDRGWGPAFMVSSGDHRVAVSSGGLDFSTFMHTEIPADRVGFQLVTHAPAGMRWCGAETADMDLFMHGPTSSIMARSPAGIRAVSMIVSLDALDEVAHDLGLGALRFPTGVEALARTPEVVALDQDLLAIAATPELLEAPSGTTRLLESVARAIAGAAGSPPALARGFDSRGIVLACLAHVESTGDNQPPLSQLCRIAHASESRVREAFVEVLGVPPLQFFRLRVLSKLRDELLDVDVRVSSVSGAASALGLTQLGRVAGRYRTVYGETPRDTLLRAHRNSVPGTELHVFAGGG